MAYKNPKKRIGRKVPIKQVKKSKKPLLVVVIPLFLLGLGALAVKNPVSALKGLLQPVSVFSQISGIGSLEKSDGRTNILLLGADRRGDDNSRGLTDTLIVASTDLKKKDVFVLSIPRDLWVEPASGKVNSIYSQKGAEVAAESIGDIVGVPIHYYVVIDFDGFIKAVDTLDGITIDVKRTFNDYFYPIPGKENDTCGLDEIQEIEEDEETSQASETEEEEEEEEEDAILDEAEIPNLEDQLEKEKDAFSYLCRFEHLYFEAGPQVMDGETVLKYARSRHASGPEGSDFARAQRQQNVMTGIQRKVLSSETLLNPTKLKSLYNTFISSIETNISFSQVQQLISQGLKIPPENVRTAVLNGGGENSPPLLTMPTDNTPYGGQWVLIPRVGDFREIQEYVQDQLFGN